MAERIPGPMSNRETAARDKDRALSGGFATGEKVSYQGEVFFVTGVKAGGIDGRQVRLDSISGPTKQWVDSTLVALYEDPTSEAA